MFEVDSNEEEEEIKKLLDKHLFSPSKQFRPILIEMITSAKESKLLRRTRSFNPLTCDHYSGSDVSWAFHHLKAEMNLQLNDERTSSQLPSTSTSDLLPLEAYLDLNELDRLCILNPLCREWQRLLKASSAPADSDLASLSDEDTARIERVQMYQALAQRQVHFTTSDYLSSPLLTEEALKLLLRAPEDLYHETKNSEVLWPFILQKINVDLKVSALQPLPSIRAHFKHWHDTYGYTLHDRTCTPVRLTLPESSMRGNFLIILKFSSY